MFAMVTDDETASDDDYQGSSILLVSDSERMGRSVGRALEEAGFDVSFAGDYSRVEAAMLERPFDVVLLEVTGEHAVESAVEAALRVKRRDATQFVGYLADSSLFASGLGGDAILPRNTSLLPTQLRDRLSLESLGEE